ncbi:MAG: hypothetical protein OEV21_01480 [Thermoplasmata archaeon]|nr:hypothetical protein [Thermoplasmata archaeon]
MRCLKCGAANPDDADRCSSCYQPLDLPDKYSSPAQLDRTRQDLISSVYQELQKSESYIKFTKELQQRCSPMAADQNERIMEQIQKLLSKGMDPGEPIENFLSQAGNLIYRLFGMTEVAISLKDDRDGLYRYILFFGMRKESETAYRRIEYTMDDVISQTKYPRIKLSEYLEFYPGEVKPFTDGEVDTFNRPSQIAQQRSGSEEMIEGDYFCLYMHGPQNQIIGWFELARPRDNKMPNRNTLIWLDLFAAIIGRVVFERRNALRTFYGQRIYQK